MSAYGSTLRDVVSGIPELEQETQGSRLWVFPKHRRDDPPSDYLRSPPRDRDDRRRPRDHERDRGHDRERERGHERGSRGGSSRSGAPPQSKRPRTGGKGGGPPPPRSSPKRRN